MPTGKCFPFRSSWTQGQTALTPEPSVPTPVPAPRGSPQRSTHRAVSLLGGRGLPGEENELGAVFLQPLHVGLQGLGGLVPPPGIC